MKNKRLSKKKCWKLSKKLLKLAKLNGFNPKKKSLYVLLRLVSDVGGWFAEDLVELNEKGYDFGFVGWDEYFNGVGELYKDKFYDDWFKSFLVENGFNL